MKIIIAPNAFKESLTAPQAATAMTRGWKKVFPDAEIFEIPVADGGDGLVLAYAGATGASILRRTVTGPLGQPVRAAFAWDELQQMAVIELAQAAGLWQVPPLKRNPMKTTSRGVGELMMAALKKNPRRIIIGLGGSATVDGGAGFAQALGWHLLDAKGKPIPAGGKGLLRLARIEPPENMPWQDVEIIGAVDVKNPLLGRNGAAVIFGPQKGASEADVKKLEDALAHFAEIVERDLGRKIAKIPGSGAAGGMGAALIAFTNAQLRMGIEVFLEAAGFESALRNCDLVLTGEGRLDAQTAQGKAPMGVAQTAASHDIPVIGFAGALGAGYEKLYDKGFSAMFSIMPAPIAQQEALSKAAVFLERQVESVARIFELSPLH